MFKTFAKVFLILALLNAVRPSARAAMQQPIVSPRLAAMGSVPVAGDDDSASLFTNPASLACVASPDLYFMYSSLFAGLNAGTTLSQGFASAAVPTRWGSFGAGIADFSATGLQEQRTVSVGYATVLGSGLRLGLAAKQLYQNFRVGGDALAAADPVFANGSSRSAVGVDIGAMLPLAAGWTGGASVQNVNSPDLGLASIDRVPRAYGVGVTRLGADRLRLAFGLSYSDPGYGALSDNLIPSVGIEKGYFDGRVALRLGANTNAFAAGFGVAFGQLMLDYAFALNRNLVADNGGTHTIGLRYAWGRPSPAFQQVNPEHKE